MEDFGDWVSLVGTVLAFATPLFLIYDRVFRGRPVFAIHAIRRAKSDNYLYVRIKNVLDHDIIIENWNINPPLVGLSTGHSEEEIAGASLGDIPKMIIAPLGELLLPLVILGAATDKHDEQIIIDADWDSTARPWPLRRRLQIKATVARLIELQSAHLPQVGMPLIG